MSYTLSKRQNRGNTMYSQQKREEVIEYYYTLLDRYSALTVPLKFRKVKCYWGQTYAVRNSETSAVFLKSVTLNSEILNKSWYFISSTIRHEIAHVVALEKFGVEGGGHGELWQEELYKIATQERVRQNYATHRA